MCASHTQLWKSEVLIQICQFLPACVSYVFSTCPIIEYACPVWNPHQAYLSNKLERIQRNVSCWILGGPIDYTERLQYLGWMELESRREFLSIIQLFKFIDGFSRVKLDNYLSFSRASTRSRLETLFKN